MKSEKVTKTFSEMSQAEYRLGNAIDDLKYAQMAYKNELIDECIGHIMRLQDEAGKLTERDLAIFLRDLVSKVSDIKSR
jgi:hypothetical protein